jgi:hypothetical protein
VNTNPLPNHASGSGFVNMLEIEHSKIVKVPMDRIYQMMVDVRYKEGSEKCCKDHCSPKKRWQDPSVCGL